MEKIILENSKLSGELNVPASKSILHRYIIAASMAKEKSKIVNVSLSDDILATISAMKNLGAKIEIKNRELLIDGSSFSNRLELDEIEDTKPLEIDCNESGSTLRFMVPISLIEDNNVIFKGKESLFKRPLDPYFKIFERNKISYKFSIDRKEKLIVKGALKSGEYKVVGNISSQFITGLLFALPLLKGNSKIIIEGNLESKSYIDLTLDTLRRFGIRYINMNYKKIYIQGSQEYKAKDIDVEADFSQAAFFIVANACGSNIEIKNINTNSLQGDRLIIDLVNQISGNQNDELEIDGSDCPDIIPVFTLYAANSNKKIKIKNIGRLRIKECDRLRATVSELSKLGFDLQEEEEAILVNYREGKKLKRKIVELSVHNDHRIAMMIAIASTIYEGKIILDDASCVKKSYPDFWEVFSSLGGKFYECMGK